jgi:uncharacterized membrane protein
VRSPATARSPYGRFDLERRSRIGFTVAMTEQTAGRAQAPAETQRTFFQWLGIIGPIVGLAFAVVFLSETSWYNVFKSIHVLAAIIWLGGGSMITVLAWRAQRAKDTGQLLQIGKQAEWLSMRVFVPASLIVLAMGIVLMHKGDWGYDHFWTLFGVIAWGVSFVVGAAFLGPQSGKLGKLIEAKGPDDPEVVARLNRVIAVARTDVLLVLLVAIDMVAKPFLT